MMGQTHRHGGALAALGGYLYLDTAGFIPEGVWGPVVLAVTYPAAMYWTVAPDADHNATANPLKDPLGKLLNLLMHPSTWFERRKLRGSSKLRPRSEARKALGDKIDAKHRSKITHSDMTLLVVFGMLFFVHSGGLGGSEINQFLVSLFLVSAGFGLLAHIVLDGLTPEGIWLVCGVALNKLLRKKIFPEKIRLVPKMSMFATGSSWETVVNRVVVILCYVCIIVIVYLSQPYRFTFGS